MSTLNTTSIQVNLTYGVGYAAGEVAVGQVEFAGLVFSFHWITLPYHLVFAFRVQVQGQAFLAATQVNNPITTLNANALVGTGFDKLSKIDATVNASGGSYGRALLHTLFAQNSSTANYMAVTLQRDGDLKDDVVGSIAISKVPSKYQHLNIDD